MRIHKEHSKYWNSGFSLPEVVIAAGITVLLGLFAVDQMKQVSILNKKSVDQSNFSNDREALALVMDYIFRRSSNLAFTNLPPTEILLGFPNPNPSPRMPAPTGGAPNRYILGNHGAIVFQSDLRVCTQQDFFFTPVTPAPGPTDKVIVMCCEKSERSPKQLNVPGGGSIIANSRCTKEPGLSIEFRKNNNQDISGFCTGNISELNIQEAGFLNKKETPIQTRVFYFLDIWSNLKNQGGGSGTEQRLSMMQTINYPPTDCRETVPKIRGFVQK